MKKRHAWLGLVFALALPPANAQTGPQAISTPTPPFPPSAIRQGHEGTVVVRVRLNANGEAVEASVEKSSGYSELDAAAVRAASNWRFRPRVVDGQNVEATVVAPVKFSHDIDLSARMPVPGPEFSCAKASSPTEKAICGDAELTGLESGMDVAYRHRHFFALPKDAKQLEKQQDAFLRERATRCITDVVCIKEMTSARLWQLPWDPAR